MGNRAHVSNDRPDHLALPDCGHRNGRIACCPRDWGLMSYGPFEANVFSLVNYPHSSSPSFSTMRWRSREILVALLPSEMNQPLLQGGYCCVRSLTLSRIRIVLTWHFTVASVIPSRFAISLLLIPSTRW